MTPSSAWASVPPGRKVGEAIVTSTNRSANSIRADTAPSRSSASMPATRARSQPGSTNESALTSPT